MGHDLAFGEMVIFPVDPLNPEVLCKSVGHWPMDLDISCIWQASAETNLSIRLQMIVS